MALNITILFTRTYNEAQISDVITSVYDYHDDYTTTAMLSESAVLEYLYE